MKRNAFVLSLLLAASAAGAQAPTRANAPSSVPAIDPNTLSTVALKVKSLRAEPSTLTIKVGETVDLNAVKVFVLDSSGAVLGRLSGFDFSIPPNEPASVVPRQLTGVREGTTTLTVRYPRIAWKARSDPRAEAKVKIVVKS